MSRLALFLLGTPRIERDGAVVRVDRRKAVAILAYLALEGESCSRDTLAALLWPDQDQRKARGALGTTLWALKKVLGNGQVNIDRKSVSLNRDAGFAVDVDHFQNLLAGHKTHSHSSEEVCVACLAPLTEAVALYRGDFLTGFTLCDSVNFDDWQRFQTESLRHEMVRALEKLVRCHGAQGEFEQALSYARRWLALDPLHEPAHCHLMQLYAWSGQRVEALRQYQECVRVLQDGLGVFPQQTTNQLYQNIKENLEPSPPFIPRFWPQPSHLHNFPALPTPFLGRKKELTDITQLLKNPTCRLLTLVGPGGIGKTRLAIQAAAENVEVFHHGVCFVPLAPLSSADEIVSTVRDALRGTLSAGTDPKTRLFNYLRGRKMLLVLDNVEHLLNGVEVLADILSQTPDVKILATSRERLNLQWEWSYGVQGLCFPRNNATSAIEDYSAVQLFIQSAKRVRPGFSLSQDSKTYVVRICQFLEGMPLGIELAAAWVQLLSCREIMQEMARNLDFLVTSQRDVPKRHRSLRAVFDHSWNLLGLEEKSAFSRLSVFRGGFCREAAEQVTGASPYLLAILAGKSFLHRNAQGRYEIIEVLRQQGAEKLQELPQEKDETHDRHCAYYADLFLRRRSRLNGRAQQKTLPELNEDIENMRAGWQWAVARGKTEEIGKLTYDGFSWAAA